MKKFLGAAERVFTIVSLVFYTGGPLTVILSGGISEGELKGIAPDYALIKQLFLLVYFITFLLLAPYWKRALYLLFKEKTILLLIGIILLSVFWSSVPANTVNRTIAIIGTTLFGVYLATRYSLKQQLQLLSLAFGLVILLSFLFAIGLPRYGTMGGIHAGAWRGIYTHKNVLGAVMTLSATVFLLLAVGARKKGWLLWGGFGLSMILLLLSRASSPLVNLTTLLTAFVIFRTFRWHYILRTFAISLIAVLGFGFTTLVTSQAEAFARLLGKDLTLTGRSDLWVYVWEAIWKRPWLGYGYGALWSESDLDAETAYIWRAAGWDAPNAHNGLLDLWLGLGLLGVLIVFVQFVMGLSRGLTLVSQSRTSEYFFPLMILVFTVLVNLTESTFLDRNSIYWVLYTSVLLSSEIRPQYDTEALAPTPEFVLHARRSTLITNSK